MSSLRSQTKKNYRDYLRPWVKWLDEKISHGPVLIDSQLIKSYLMEKYRDAEYSTYERNGRQIVLFMNRYLTSKVHFIKPIHHQRQFGGLNMPSANVEKIISALKERFIQLSEKSSTIYTRKELARVLGKAPVFVHRVTPRFCAA